MPGKVVSGRLVEAVVAAYEKAGRPRDDGEKVVRAEVSIGGTPGVIRAGVVTSTVVHAARMLYAALRPARLELHLLPVSSEIETLAIHVGPHGLLATGHLRGASVVLQASVDRLYVYGPPREVQELAFYAAAASTLAAVVEDTAGFVTDYAPVFEHLACGASTSSTWKDGMIVVTVRGFDTECITHSLEAFAKERLMELTRGKGLD